MAAEGKSIIVTISSLLLSVLFVCMGAITKLTGAEFQKETFSHYGYPEWLMYIVGLAELVCGGIILFSRTRFVAALGMICITVGVILSMARVGELSWHAIASPAGITMLVAASVAWAARPGCFRRSPMSSRKGAMN